MVCLTRAACAWRALCPLSSATLAAASTIFLRSTRLLPRMPPDAVMITRDLPIRSMMIKQVTMICLAESWWVRQADALRTLHGVAVKKTPKHKNCYSSCSATCSSCNPK